MKINRAVSAVIAGISGGFMFLVLNIFFNPNFGHNGDMMHRIGAVLVGSGFFRGNNNFGRIIAVLFILFAVCIAYALLIMLLVKKKKPLKAVLWSIIPGIGLYFIRLFFLKGNDDFTAYIRSSWRILLIYILFSIFIAWQYKWIRKKARS
jgi:hypothetical protein